MRAVKVSLFQMKLIGVSRYRDTGVLTKPEEIRAREMLESQRR